ncbi:hypothetical protein B7P43_G05590, partial [Cryptotermes secundus]
LILSNIFIRDPNLKHNLHFTSLETLLLLSWFPLLAPCLL